MAEKSTLVLRNIKQLVTVCNQAELLKKGTEQGKITIIENGAVVCKNGKIIFVGSDKASEEHFSPQEAKILDLTGKCVIPGLVDSHTHPIWSGDRVHEFVQKLEGATYMEIHKKGGGIGFTVRHTKESSEAELAELLKGRLDRMLKLGTTTVEAKSGYGLELQTELKLLKVLHSVNKVHKIDLVSSFLGAHSVPTGSTSELATEDIVKNQIPALKKMMDNDEISPTLIDVFCEAGVFSVDETKKILEAGKTIGLESNFHGDELKPTKSAELAGEIGALAMSHCEEVSHEGILLMAKRPTCAILLPTTAYLLKLKYPPAREMIQNNVPVALGSDFNPNAHCMSMPFVMNMACVLMGMTPAEALVAATINSAYSIGKSQECGSIEVNKWADLLVLDAQSWEHVIYEMVDPPIQIVIKKGEIVFESK